MLNVHNEQVRKHLLDNKIGLEKESLRILENGHFAHTPHPDAESEYIVRDFCENQTEINTPVFRKTSDALKFMLDMEQIMYLDLAYRPEPELLWPFSNPPYIKNEQDIPTALYTGQDADKTVYRNYLAEKYGKYKMTFSGIHFNFSFGEKLLQAGFEASGRKNVQDFVDDLYLHLAKEAALNGWLITILTAASPVLDSSFVEKGNYDHSIYTGIASYRSCESGYWNYFTPVFDYTSVDSYQKSIQSYIEEGLIRQASELYYPIRLKPKGQNRLENFSRGLSHIELRMLDLNPFSIYGLAAQDVDFIRYFLVYLACTDSGPADPFDQVQAAANFKNASHMDLRTVRIFRKNKTSIPMLSRAKEILNYMERFYDKLGIDIHPVLDYQRAKLQDKRNRYAYKVKELMKDHYVQKGLEMARNKREVLLRRAWRHSFSDEVEVPAGLPFFRKTQSCDQCLEE